MNDVEVIEWKLFSAKHGIAMLLKKKLIYIYIYKREKNLLQSCVRMLLQIVFKHIVFNYLSLLVSL